MTGDVLLEGAGGADSPVTLWPPLGGRATVCGLDRERSATAGHRHGKIGRQILPH